MNLSEIRRLLSESGIRLTKSLGQNFLHDGNQLRRIVELADLRRSDRVLEIGPGLGPLTELLLANAGEVLAIEKDARLYQCLTQRLHLTQPGTQGRFRLLHDDALGFLQSQQRDWMGWKVVSNLPYSVASPILVELAQTPAGPERIVVTLQLEVARRLMAKPGNADYGILTLLVQLTHEPSKFFKVPASCFFPKPDVDSACLLLLRRPQPLLNPLLRPTFARIVKRSFSQRRKFMAKLLREDWPMAKVTQAFEQLQLPLQIRAESVSLNQFVSLTQELTRLT
jgi:16S rRNA (adenine1518-N6/adenine1519-N6)-dimethyltransferase